MAPTRAGFWCVKSNLDGPANQQLFARTDVIAEVLRPSPRRAVKTVAELERALSRVRDGDIVSLYVYNIRGQTETAVSRRDASSICGSGGPIEEGTAKMTEFRIQNSEFR